MNNDFKSNLLKADLPTFIEKYYLTRKEILLDESLQICYDSDDHGYFTITVYKYQGKDVPADLDDPIMLNELDRCIEAILGMEDEGNYHNVQLLIKEPFQFEDTKETISNGAVLGLQQVLEDGSLTDPMISILMLRSDMQYYHKIRFSTSVHNEKDVSPEIEKFLKFWLEYITYVGVKAN